MRLAEATGAEKILEGKPEPGAKNKITKTNIRI
jgi:hypothetical protein